MRTSGADTDTVLYLIPVSVLLYMGIRYVGGFDAFMRYIDQGVIDGFAWLSRLVR